MGFTSNDLDAEALLMRMRAGDRAAAAEFLDRYGTRIRRRIRGKLGPAMRRLFDSQEIMSTLGRRLDAFVRTHQLSASSEPQLWSLVFTIADHALAEKARVFQALQRVEGEDSVFAQRVLGRLREAEERYPDGPEIEIDRVLRSLDDPEDRQVLSLWLLGSQQRQIAEAMGLSLQAVRWRWERVRGRVREALDVREN
jgi:RNA polymerase sigma-70 factor, ECF subfamily